ncbi:MAG: 50S ribosomal protein L22 [Akkermansiaceae bacterium]|jgi:large subunit ribosomal protein L22|nr:50S ribosomal protein L22 [Roseibacillus sp.]
MEVRSIYKYARISPKKARDVAREIQGLPVSDAIDTLNFTPKKAAFLIGKTLKSAVANAENNHDLAADTLHVKEANVSDGPSFRRFKPRARGSASAIKKRTSHIYIILTDEMEVEEKPKRESKPKKKKGAPKKEEPIAEEEAPAEVEEEVPAAEEAPEAEAEEVTESTEEAPEEESAEEDKH